MLILFFFIPCQFNKDGGEDDSDSASRGNWWQGMLILTIKILCNAETCLFTQ